MLESGDHGYSFGPGGSDSFEHTFLKENFDKLFEKLDELSERIYCLEIKSNSYGLHLAMKCKPDAENGFLRQIQVKPVCDGANNPAYDGTPISPDYRFMGLIPGGY
jgi:hypothetical protein